MESERRPRQCFVSLQDRRTAFGRGTVDDTCSDKLYANRIAADLKNNGYLFWRNGNGWSVAKSTLDVVRGFTKLTRGQEIDRDELSQVWRKIKVDRKIRTAGNKMLKAI